MSQIDETSVSGGEEESKPGRAPEIVLVLLVIALAIGLAGIVAVDRTVVIDDVRETNELLFMRIDINTASEAELMLLPTIGPRLAERIVEDRGQRGQFASLADLARVHGIGPATLERIEPYVIWHEPEAIAAVEP